MKASEPVLLTSEQLRTRAQQYQALAVAARGRGSRVPLLRLADRFELMAINASHGASDTRRPCPTASNSPTIPRPSAANTKR